MVGHSSQATMEALYRKQLQPVIAKAARATRGPDQLPLLRCLPKHDGGPFAITRMALSPVSEARGLNPRPLHPELPAGRSLRFARLLSRDASGRSGSDAVALVAVLRCYTAAIGVNAIGHGSGTHAVPRGSAPPWVRNARAMPCAVYGPPGKSSFFSW